MKLPSAKCLPSPAHQRFLFRARTSRWDLCCFVKAADEAEILTICTRPAFRQKGHGKLLMQHLETLLKSEDVKSLFIEVAVSNRAGLALYASCGFEKAGMRKNYYERNDGKREDALIMRKGL